jgi:copper chaperone
MKDRRGGEMSKRSVTVPNISCRHCTAAIERELREIPGVRSVEADPVTKEVTVQWEPPATWELIAGKLSEIGYPAAETRA